MPIMRQAIPGRLQNEANRRRFVALCLLLIGKGGEIMRAHTYFASLSLAGLLLANPATAIADDSFASLADVENSVMGEQTQEFSTDESARQADPAQHLELTATDFCYAGSTSDPATGEILAMFVLCDERSTAVELDLA